MRRFIFLTTALLSTVSYASDSAIRYVWPQQYHGEEVEDIKEGESWFGIVKRGEGYYAEAATSKVELVLDPLMDKEEGPWTGKKISFMREGQPHEGEFYVSGLSLKDGTLIPTYTKVDVAEGEFSAVQLHGGREMVTLVQTYTEIVRHEHTSTPMYAGFQLVVKVGDTQTALTDVVQTEEGIPHLHWAGDLNGDDYPDLLVDVNHKGNGDMLALFLSRVGKEGVTYDKVASRVALGC